MEASMFIKVQAVIPNDGKLSRRDNRPGVHVGNNFIFVSNTEESVWSKGVGEFTVMTRKLGEPVDFQGLIFVDPSREQDTATIPVAFHEGQFKPLPTVNKIVSGWEPHIYKFNQPIYLIRVRRDGQARIDEYTPLFDEKNIKKGEGSYILKIKCERLYSSPRAPFDKELLLKQELNPVIRDLARFLITAYQSLHTVATEEPIQQPKHEDTKAAKRARQTLNGKKPARATDTVNA
jgi:hypothetical protein